MTIAAEAPTGPSLGFDSPEVANSSFSKILPGLQLGWDSTSYNAFDKCPRYYQYAIIEGWTYPSTNDHLRFGLIFHSATELYDRRRAKADDHEAALLHVVRHILEACFDKLGEPINGVQPRRLWESAQPTKTPRTLLRTVVWYLDRFKDDPLETLILDNGRPAVEQSFRFGLSDFADFKSCTGEEYMLCGHLDKVATWNDETWVPDKKTTKFDLSDQYFLQYNPDNQMAIYSIAGIVTLQAEIDGVIIDGIQILVNGSRFRRKQIPYSRDLLEEWLKDFRIKLLEAESYAKLNYWPMRRKSCGFGNNLCTFHKVCSEDTIMREDTLQGLFTKRVWDPLQPR